MALREDDEYQRLFDAAMNAREDGDREESAGLFGAMLERYPADAAVLDEYVRGLIGLKQFSAAGAVLERAFEQDPSNYKLRELWATLPFKESDWSEQIRRDRLFRDSLPEAQKHLGKQSLIFAMVAYWESAQWAELATFIQENRLEVISDPNAFSIALQKLGLIGRHEDIRALIDAAPTDAWSRLPSESQINIRLRLQEAAQNRRLVEGCGVRIVSLGQHCLPYQLGARWGFLPEPIVADHMTPFDLGAFHGDSAARAITGDFMGFDEPAGFTVIPHWGGGVMFRHPNSGVYFHHERGPYWLENDGVRFFARSQRMLANWRRFKTQGKRLFVFCLIGEGDVNLLVEAVGNTLLDRNSRLLVINLLKEPRPGPVHERVTYLHAPYPKDYIWVELPYHSSERGFSFEKAISEAFRAQISELAAAPTVSDADYPEYQRLLRAAIDAREDGEPEDSAAYLKMLLNKFEGDAGAALELVKTSRSLGKTDDAELALVQAIENNQHHFQLRKAWVDLPTFSQNWEESIKRGRVLRAAFPPPQYPEAWRTLEIEYDFLYDIGQWDVLANLIDANWGHYKNYANAMPGGLGALNNLFLTDKLGSLVEEAAPEAWALLPGEALENLRLRAAMARQNLDLVARTGVRVISIGQNCLPYLLGGRWGLLGSPADALTLQPFELGGFHNDNVAEAIETEFASFKDRDNYVIAGAYGGGQMYTHKPSNVGFFHERGPWWMSDPERFFARIDLMLANWAKIQNAGKRLFVFCYCGAGSLERLVAMADKHLLGPDAHLLIIDVLQEPHTPPEHERVSYIHSAYPRDYTWTKVAHQVSARGMAFELSIVNPITALLAEFDPQQDGQPAAARLAAARSRMLHESARKARAAGQLENAVSLLGTLLTETPEDAAAALEQSHILGQLKRTDEADAVLARAMAHAPADFSLGREWAQMPIHSADWNATIERSGKLRASFPPAMHRGAYYSFNAELSAYYDSGRWEEAIGFIHRHWDSFTTRPELLGNALDVLGKLFRPHGVREMLDSATPAALQGLNAEIIAGITLITDAAIQNQWRLRAHDARVISLGHNAQCFIFAGRWGLNAGPARHDGLTPFDIGGFTAAAAAEAIATDFAAYDRPEDFIEAPAWFGGVMLVHEPTGTNFLSHRRARWGPEDRAQFFAHLNTMVANWRRTRNLGQRVFLLSLSDGADLPWIVASLNESLLDARSHLVMVDMRAGAEAFTPPERVTYLSAPPPRHYAWPRLTGCATREVISYEQRIAAAITSHLPR